MKKSQRVGETRCNLQRFAMLFIIFREISLNNAELCWSLNTQMENLPRTHNIWIILLNCFTYNIH